MNSILLKQIISQKHIQFLQVYLDGELYGRITYNKKTNPYVIEAGGVMVRTIRIEVGENSTSGVLTLCEVEVFSANPPGKTGGGSSSKWLEHMLIKWDF